MKELCNGIKERGVYEVLNGDSAEGTSGAANDGYHNLGRLRLQLLKTLLVLFLALKIRNNVILFLALRQRNKIPET